MKAMRGVQAILGLAFFGCFVARPIAFAVSGVHYSTFTACATADRSNGVSFSTANNTCFADATYSVRSRLSNLLQLTVYSQLRTRCASASTFSFWEVQLFYPSLSCDGPAYTYNGTGTGCTPFGSAVSLAVSRSVLTARLILLCPVHHN
jgi:hypothetical protein